MAYHDIKKIYDSLQDEQSRIIFEKRLMFSLSGDIRHIHSMIDIETDRYKEDDVMYRLLEWLDSRRKKVVVFGSGFAGYEIISILRQKNIDVLCFVDNDSKLWGSEKYGIKIKDPDELRNIENVAVIIGTNNNTDEIKKQLLSIGIEEKNLFVPKTQWWLGKYRQYFDPYICIPNKNEVFVDGGAFDGEDTVRFMQWNNEGSCLAYLFEPEIKHFKKIEKKMSSLENVKLFDKGLWDCEDMKSFDATTNADSSIQDTGEETIQTVALDGLNLECIPTFIKMDIEGSEIRALEGARKTITNHKPRLAICVYHKPEDIVDIPGMILDMVPDYKLYLRHYSYIDTETVLYAV